MSVLQGLRTRWKGVRRFVRNIHNVGTARRCPVCGFASRRFVPFRRHPNPEAECIYCGALERHRFVWLYFQLRTDLFDGQPKRVLHVAPELCFIDRLRKRLGEGYQTGDLSSRDSMLKFDVTEIPFPDASFDVIYCSHVLEHVLDDRRAMREFYRVLRPGGWAILLVPITVSGPTYEDPSVVDPQERLRLFGQHDHVRRYGPDYVDRLRDAGFSVSETNASDMFNDSEMQTMGIAHYAGAIHYCTKPTQN